MDEYPPRVPIERWGTEYIAPGEGRDVQLAIGQSYSGMTVNIPLHIRRSQEDGPVVFITAALHGDELNGTGAIRLLIQDEMFWPTRGSLILVPVLNLLAFDRHSRYLPDRRDLNRSFPGSPSGSLASRMAHSIFEEIVRRSHYGIDLHTAAVRRTNYPTVRGDLSNPRVRELATAFGGEIVMNGRGPRGSFRREACAAHCPTIVMEGGEVWKVEPSIVAAGLRGIRNVLRFLNMLDGPIESPEYQVTIERSKWVRAEQGGFLQFHVSPGDIVEKDQPLATHTTLLGREASALCSPFNGVVIGMSTLPAVSPGEPVCHIGQLPKSLSPQRLQRQRSKEDGLEMRLAEDLSSNVLIVDPPEDAAP